MPGKKTIKVNRKTAKGKKGTVFTNEEALSILSAIAVRAGIAARLGKSFSGDRDIYTALGYNTSPGFEDYMAKYERQDIARAIIDKPVRASWRRPPTITELDQKESKFEKQWIGLVENKRIYHHLSRADRLASIGTYAALFLGFDDGKKAEEEIGSASKLLYLTPYSMENAAIAESEIDQKDERYGLPKIYEINIKVSGADATRSSKVHWSRVIHVAEDLLEDNVEGIPRLRAVLNRLQDLEIIAGASAEGFFRGAFPGFGLKKQPDATFEKQDKDALTDEMEEYLHGFKRFFRIQGIDIQELKPQIADPSNHISAQIDLISAATGIPKRILLGSERGELASSQDEKNWADRIDERRKEHCEQVILRPLIDRLIKVGVLPKPAEGYTVKWPDMMTPSEKDTAEVGEILAKALKAYVDAMGAQEIVPPEIFLQKLGFSKDEVEQINLILKKVQKEEGDGEE